MCGSMQLVGRADARGREGGSVSFKPQCVPDGDYVCLLDSQVTDAALEHIKWWPEIKVLVLDQTQITDAGLQHLKGLTQLERLGLKRTKVTDEGVKKLQQALPNCKIVR